MGSLVEIEDPGAACLRALGVAGHRADLQDELAHHSDVHSNGFSRLCLPAEVAGESWFVHLWGAEPTADVHDHRWDFWSFVLAGCLTVERYDAGGGDEFVHFAHVPHAGDEGHTLHCLGRRRLRLVDRRRVVAGTAYTGRGVELHRVVADGGPATTFFRHGPNTRRATNVLRQRAGDHAVPTRSHARVPLSRADYVTSVAAVAAMLG